VIADARLAELATRREALVARAAAERAAIAEVAEPLVAASVWVERGLGLWHTLRDHPWLVAVPVAVATVLARRRGTLRAVSTALTFWRIGRSVLRLLNAAGPAR
jgi:hypothetical protein